jgi:hypothetical protein
MEVLKVRHILDNILSNLREWYSYDYLNLISALNLTNEYAHRELGLKKLDSISKALLTQNLKYFTFKTIRSHFDLFWNNVDLSEFNENFFIDNEDLIDHQKLKQLKRQNTKFDYCNLYLNVYPHSNKRNFSDIFHQIFPIYNGLKICSSYTWVPIHPSGVTGNDDAWDECLTEVKVMGQLCDTCKANKCPRCGHVIQPQLELDDWGCCEECAGCSQYDNYD